jgi:GNAT superfamily N-acetyltransferase
MPGDAAALAILLAELGYPAAPDVIPERLARLAAFGRAIALVAAGPAGVLGVVTAHVFPSLHAAADVAWITSLVVSEDGRGQGVGRRLVEAVESWARARGAVRLSVSSGLARAGAHAFYERLGYAPSGRRFTKTLGE